MGNIPDDIINVFKKQQAHRLTVRNTSYRERLKKLNNLEKILLASRKELSDALYSDFKKPATETDITELYVVLQQIRHVKSNLRNWMRDIKVSTPVSLLGSRSYITYHGKGTCLIISPWNYPVNLALGPLVSAIAAGNTAIIKPSEKTVHATMFLKMVIGKVFNEEEIAVIGGGEDTARQLLELPFDHIFFTGSVQTGKKIMEAATKNLTSVTLELGGKSPCYVERDASLKDSAEKIAAAKFVNAGQTCIAPDYILAHHEVAAALMQELQNQIPRYYKGRGSEYAAIISDAQLKRIDELTGNNGEIEDGRMKPMVVMTVVDSALMEEEIFGPVLPVISVTGRDEALRIISGLPSPLGIYVFSKSRETLSFFNRQTWSGSICYNECAVQFLNPALPFGGIGYSGYGRSHGLSGFRAFSNEKSVFVQRRGATTVKLLYPPYTKFKKRLVTWLLKYF